MAEGIDAAGVVVVGGGLSGAKTVEALRDAGFDGRLVLADASGAFGNPTSDSARTMTTTATTATPIAEFVWCTECEEPHAYDADDGTLNLLGEDRESKPCQEPQRVKKLPQDWEKTYEAHAVYDFKGFQGYDLYKTSPAVDPTIHRPMYYLER